MKTLDIRAFFEAIEQFRKEFIERTGVVGQVFIAIIEIVITVAVAAIITKYIRRGIKKLFEKYKNKRQDPAISRKSDTAVQLINGVIKFFISFSAIIIVLDILGLRAGVTSMIATAGVGALVIGISAQSIIGDIINGILLLIEDQYGVGDFICIAGYTGTVEHFSVRSTRIQLLSKEFVTVPNGQIKDVVNYSRQQVACIIQVNISPDTDIDLAISLMKATIEDIIEENDQVFTKTVNPTLTDINETSAVLTAAVNVIAPTNITLKYSAKTKLLEVFRNNGIDFPVQSINIVNRD